MCRITVSRLWHCCVLVAIQLQGASHCLCDFGTMSDVCNTLIGLAGNAGSLYLNIGNYRKDNARFGNAGIENEPVCYSRISVCGNRFALNDPGKIVGKLTQN